MLQHVSVLFPCIVEWYSFVWIAHGLLTYLCISWWTYDFIPCWTVMNNHDIKSCVHFFLWIYVFTSLVSFSRFGITESYGDLRFNILGNCQMRLYHYMFQLAHKSSRISSFCSQHVLSSISLFLPHHGCELITPAPQIPLILLHFFSFSF